MFNLKDKVAIVTGATRGLGQGMAIGLAKAGANIVGAGRGDFSETKKLVEEQGVKFLGVKIDLLNLDGVDNLVNSTIEEFGKIDILVNNAGMIKRNDIFDFSEKDWDDVMNVNLKSMFFLSQSVGKIMAKSGSGKIINIASMLSYQGGIRVPSYTASKSGVKGLTMILANELSKYHINVNAIAPGYMATDNTQALRDDPIRNEQILGRIPAGRWGKPSDLEGAVVFLASEGANYIQGITLPVDGGWLAR